MKVLNTLFLILSSAAFFVSATPLQDVDASLQGSTHTYNVTRPLIDRSTGISVVLAMGNQKRNVGFMIGSNAYGTVYTALNHLCPRHSDRCDTSRHYDIKVKASRNSYLEEDIIRVTAFDGHWGNEGLRSTMIGSIAAAVEKQTLDAKNCYKTMHGRMCNMGDFIGITISTIGTIGGKYNMDIHFNGHGAAGNFDCVAIIGVVDDVLKASEKDFVADMGFWGVHVERKTWCLNRGVTRDVTGGVN